MKPVIGIVLAFVIGFACRAFDIPSPAPPVIVGALLVMAMTVGYLLVDRWVQTPAVHAVNCAGPSGLPAGTSKNGMRIVESIALLGLCAAYIQGGLVKLLDFNGAIGEMNHFGIPLPTLMAAATIITELAGSALVLSGFYRWVGALWLAAFTLAATFVANRFWEIPQPDRFMVENGFFEHLGLVGGFLLVALYDWRQRMYLQIKQ